MAAPPIPGFALFDMLTGLSAGRRLNADCAQSSWLRIAALLVCDRRDCLPLGRSRLSSAIHSRFAAAAAGRYPEHGLSAATAACGLSRPISGAAAISAAATVSGAATISAAAAVSGAATIPGTAASGAGASPGGARSFGHPGAAVAAAARRCARTGSGKSRKSRRHRQLRPPRRQHRRRRLRRPRSKPDTATDGHFPRPGRRYDRCRDADRENRERPGGICRPRQDHRPHHQIRCRNRRNGAIRRAAGHGAGLLYAAADRADQHRRLYRSRRGDPAGRDQAHLHRLDVRIESRIERRRAPDLRRLAHGLRTAADGSGRGIHANAAAARHSRPDCRARAGAAAARTSGAAAAATGQAGAAGT